MSPDLRPYRSDPNNYAAWAARTPEERSAVAFEINPSDYRYSISLLISTGDAETVRAMTRDFASWGFDMSDAYARCDADDAKKANMATAAAAAPMTLCRQCEAWTDDLHGVCAECRADGYYRIGEPESYTQTHTTAKGN